MKSIKFFVFVILINLSLNAQWTSNTAVNTVVCDTTGEQSVSKLALCPDGSTYHAWFDNRGGSYAVYIQKLDPNGVRQFPPAAILVSNNPQNSFTVDWDMIADNNNNAIITFTDIRNGGDINPFAYMISPAGVQMWGANGVTLSDSVNAFQPNPKVVQTSDGNYVFLWRIGSGTQKLALQKLNAAGAKLWGSSPILWTSGTTENYDWPALVPSDNGSVILMYSAYTGTSIYPPNYRIYSQKVSSAGTRVWNATQDTVYSLGGIARFYTPRLFSDGNGGAIYCWHDGRGGNTNGYIQRKNSAGAIQFPVNGSAVSGNAANQHFTPIACYMPATGETYVAWQEANGGQTQWGFYAQRFSPTGSQLWTSNGLAIQPLGSNQPLTYTVMTRDTNVIICFNQDALLGNSVIKAARLGKSGGYLWSGNIITPGSITSSKLRLNSVINQTSGMSILSWQDERNVGGGGIYAQNINFDGTFGTTTGIISINNEIPERFELIQNYPNPFNPSTVIRYKIKEVGNVKLTVFDILGNSVKELVNEKQNAGIYEVGFKPDGLASGIYFYRLTSGGFTGTMKMILVK